MQLNWTGERLVPRVMKKDRAVVKEHFARYNWVLQFCKNKIVLDAASGSGYGINLISSVASEAIGLDVALDAIKYSREKYTKPRFGICDLEKGYTIKSDIVISFETIEHLSDPNEFLASVKKNCRETFIFSIPVNLPGEFHKVVYSIEEIKALISKHFDNVEYLCQEGEVIKPIINDAKFLIGIAKLK